VKQPATLHLSDSEQPASASVLCGQEITLDPENNFSIKEELRECLVTYAQLFRHVNITLCQDCLSHPHYNLCVLKVSEL